MGGTFLFVNFIAPCIIPVFSKLLFLCLFSSVFNVEVFPQFSGNLCLFLLRNETPKSFMEVWERCQLAGLSKGERAGRGCGRRNPYVWLPTKSPVWGPPVHLLRYLVPSVPKPFWVSAGWTGSFYSDEPGKAPPSAVHSPPMMTTLLPYCVHSCTLVLVGLEFVLITMDKKRWGEAGILWRVTSQQDLIFNS